MKILKKTLTKKIIILFISIILLATSSISFVEGQRVVNKKYIQENSLTKETSENSYDLLIITPEKFSAHVQPLVDHKNKYGVVKTISVNIEDVYEQIFWRGKDKAEKLKYFIKDAIEYWNITYVLLIGGREDQSKQETWAIPIRYSHIERGYLRTNGAFLPESKFLTDLYFADIYDSEDNFSSWDDNDNGLYSEWPNNKSAIDIPDLIPDVFVGRLPCRTVFDVKVVVNKIINYESKKADDSWFKKMVVIGGDTYPDKTDYYDGEVYNQMALDMMDGFEPVKVWGSDGSLKNWVDIAQALRPGCGFVFFSGHGSCVSWSTPAPDDASTWIGRFNRIHMAFLNNRGKLPVALCASGCFVSNFNVSIGYSSRAYWMGIPINVPSCWSWTLTKKIGGGSIATIGSTGFSYESPDVDSGVGGCEQLDLNFFHEYGENGVETLGKAWGNAVTAFVQNFTVNWTNTSITGDALIAKNAQQWVLFGDPSLKIGGYDPIE